MIEDGGPGHASLGGHLGHGDLVEPVLGEQAAGSVDDPGPLLLEALGGHGL